MAQNSTGTANSVNPYAGGNAGGAGTTNDPVGVPDGKGSGVITGDSGQITNTHVEYRYTANFPTDTIKKGP